MLEVGELRSRPQCDDCPLRGSITDPVVSAEMRLALMLAVTYGDPQLLPDQIRLRIEGVRKKDDRSVCDHLGRIILELFAEFDLISRPDAMLGLRNLVERATELEWIEERSVNQPKSDMII
jgi:hypothetical protein